jgi:hypothetical protein
MHQVLCQAVVEQKSIAAHLQTIEVALPAYLQVCEGHNIHLHTITNSQRLLNLDALSNINLKLPDDLSMLEAALTCMRWVLSCVPAGQ